MSKRTLLLPLSMVALAGALAAWTLINPTGKARQDQPANAGKSEPAVAFAPISTTGWQPGTTYVHDVKLRMHMSGHSLSDTKVQVAGRWKSTVVRSSATERDLEVTFEPAAPGPVAADGYASMPEVSELHQTFVARYDGRGAAREPISPGRCRPTPPASCGSW